MTVTNVINYHRFSYGNCIKLTILRETDPNNLIIYTNMLSLFITCIYYFSEISIESNTLIGELKKNNLENEKKFINVFFLKPTYVPIPSSIYFSIYPLQPK